MFAAFGVARDDAKAFARLVLLRWCSRQFFRKKFIFLNLVQTVMEILPGIPLTRPENMKWISQAVFMIIIISPFLDSCGEWRGVAQVLPWGWSLMVWLAASQSWCRRSVHPQRQPTSSHLWSVEADLAATHWQGLATEMHQRCHPKPQRSLERDVVGNVPKALWELKWWS